MTVNFLRPAEDELVETIAFYNLQSEGLGFEFAAEVKRTIVSMASSSLQGLWPNKTNPAYVVNCAADLRRFRTLNGGIHFVY